MTPMRLLATLVLVLVLAHRSPWLAAQAAPRFEVVSIKPATSQEAGRVSAEGGRVTMTNAPVSALIITAYVRDRRLPPPGCARRSKKTILAEAHQGATVSAGRTEST